MVDDEDTRRYITFGYYYRDVDWTSTEPFKDTYIGSKYPTVDDFDEGSKQVFLENQLEFNG